MLRALALAVLLACTGASRGDAPVAPLPGPDGVARYGGDEFVVLAGELDRG